MLEYAACTGLYRSMEYRLLLFHPTRTHDETIPPKTSRWHPPSRKRKALFRNWKMLQSATRRIAAAAADAIVCQRLHTLLHRLSGFILQPENGRAGENCQSIKLVFLLQRRRALFRSMLVALDTVVNVFTFTLHHCKAPPPQNATS